MSHRESTYVSDRTSPLNCCTSAARCSSPAAVTREAVGKLPWLRNERSPSPHRFHLKAFQRLIMWAKVLPSGSRRIDIWRDVYHYHKNSENLVVLTIRPGNQLEDRPLSIVNKHRQWSTISYISLHGVLSQLSLVGIPTGDDEDEAIEFPSIINMIHHSPRISQYYCGVGSHYLWRSVNHRSISHLPQLVLLTRPPVSNPSWSHCQGFSAKNKHVQPSMQPSFIIKSAIIHP